tara:strand:- start:254 stop:412 length:159 start_codon:yes stop_codon:yes gene_type:complete
MYFSLALEIPLSSYIREANSRPNLQTATKIIPSSNLLFNKALYQDLSMDMSL